jgi:hypothetical protein
MARHMHTTVKKKAILRLQKRAQLERTHQFDALIRLVNEKLSQRNIAMNNGTTLVIVQGCDALSHLQCPRNLFSGRQVVEGIGCKTFLISLFQHFIIL